MGIQSFDKRKFSPQRCIVAIKLFLPNASVVHPVTDALVADKLSRSNRLIYCSVLSCFSFDFKFQNDRLTWKNSTAIV
jgi:hypothetical protein